MSFKKVINEKNIKKYFFLAKKFGESDKGQAVIIGDGMIILKEDSEGTDSLINRFKHHKNYKFTCLVKVSKPKQDLRIDLPTIGPKTIENIIKAGIKGIIVEHNKTFVENPDLTFKLIKKNSIFFYAF